MLAAEQKPAEDLFQLTPLRAVRDWGWGLYVARYWRDEAHALTGQDPLLEREFVESENGVDRWLCYGEYAEDYPEGGWPHPRYGGDKAGWVSWELKQAGMEQTLRFVPGRIAGTRVEGSGWRTPLPYNWF
jgi:hypothetical protein